MRGTVWGRGKGGRVVTMRRWVVCGRVHVHGVGRVRMRSLRRRLRRSLKFSYMRLDDFGFPFLQAVGTQQTGLSLAQRMI